MLRNEGDKLSLVVVCTPRVEYFNVANLREHNINEIADQERTSQQHDLLKEALAKAGGEVMDVGELENHPNSVFTRDIGLSTPEGYIMLRMGLASRRGEEGWMAKMLEGMGEPCAGVITEPGTVEGGDIILAGSVAFIGHSERTNEEGVGQISNLLIAMGFEVRTARVKGSLHLGGIMSVIGPRKILCCREMLPPDFLNGFDTIRVPYRGPSTGNVICINEDEVIANSAENVEAIEILSQNGVKVHPIDLSEFRKGAGGPSCLILPVRRG